ncbi:MAG: hypothetical protein Q8O67_24455 [Deltaproteobacteria bacterium]|nr:hypothetical protein [Deltaproteobacteria bacterium]
MRIHAPELEDEAWCPRFLRDGLTAFLQVASERMRIYDNAAPVVAAVLHGHPGAKRLVDLCSGGGGPLLRLREALAKNHAVDVDAVLTDLYPNLGAFDEACSRGLGKVSAMRESVDATDVPASLDGVRTVFNAFHHFRPELARRIVEDAARKRQPFVSLEVVERRLQTVLFLMGTPFAVLVFTPFSRPLTLERVLFTYVIPLIPLGVFWDGMCSCLRAYDVDELKAVTAGLDDDGYQFRVERIEVPWTPLRITALIGEPSRSR